MRIRYFFIKFTLVLLVLNAHAEIPHYFNSHLAIMTANFLRIPFASYFTENQKNLIEEIYTDNLINHFRSYETPPISFKRADLLKLVKENFQLIFREKVELPSPINLNELKAKVAGIFFSYYQLLPKYSKPVGYLVSPWANNVFLLQIKYKKAIYPFSIRITEDQEAIMKLYGLPMTVDSTDNCLFLSFKLDSKTLQINWIGTKETVCPLSAKQKGNFLLELGEEIAKALDMHETKLWDVSNVLCTKNDKSIDLKLLKIFQQGRTWYESKGYKYKDNYYKDYRSKVAVLYYYSVLSFKSDLRNLYIKLRSEKAGLIKGRLDYYLFLEKTFQEILAKMDEYQKESTNPFFSGFMAWLYEKDCAFYSDIVDLILPEDRFSIKPYLTIGLYYSDEHGLHKDIRPK